MSYLEIAEKVDEAPMVSLQSVTERRPEVRASSSAGEEKTHRGGQKGPRSSNVDGYRRKARLRTDVAAQKLNVAKQNARRSLEKKAERLRAAAAGAKSKKEVPLVCRPSRATTTKSKSDAPRLCGATADWWEQKLKKRGLHTTPTSGKKFRLTAKTAASEAAKWGIT